MHHRDLMETIAKVYLRNQECSVQNPVNHILPESKLGRNFPAMYFADADLQQERV